MVLQLVKVHFVPVESMNRDDNKSKRNIISNDMLVSELEPCGTFKKKTYSEFEILGIIHGGPN